MNYFSGLFHNQNYLINFNTILIYKLNLMCNYIFPKTMLNILIIQLGLVYDHMNNDKHRIAISILLFDYRFDYKIDDKDLITNIV